MAKLPIDITKIDQVFIGKTHIEGYACPKIECIAISGYIDAVEETGPSRIVYLECTHGGSCGRKCHPLRSMLDFKYSEGSKAIMHRGGSKGQIMDEILEDFQESPLKEIKIPIKTNLDDVSTYPANVKKAFLVFKEMEMYDTELEAEVIDTIKTGILVDRYVLTVKKIGGSEEKSKKEKIVKAFKSFKNFFGPEEDQSG